MIRSSVSGALEIMSRYLGRRGGWSERSLLIYCSYCVCSSPSPSCDFVPAVTSIISFSHKRRIYSTSYTTTQGENKGTQDSWHTHTYTHASTALVLFNFKTAFHFLPHYLSMTTERASESRRILSLFTTFKRCLSKQSLKSLWGQCFLKGCFEHQKLY